MTKVTKNLSEEAQQAHDYLLKLGQVTIDFAKVNRVPHYALGHPENDVEHSYHLAISAIELAADFHSELDVGLVAQFSLVHDLPEVHVGDVPTFNITDEGRTAKETAEKEATKRLLNELPPHLAQLLKRYEDQVEPEARFVRYIDKLLPAVINILTPNLSREIFKNYYNVNSRQSLMSNEEKEVARLAAMFPEFDFVHIIRKLVISSRNEHMYREN